jgi:hypothetical protein
MSVIWSDAGRDAAFRARSYALRSRLWISGPPRTSAATRQLQSRETNRSARNLAYALRSLLFIFFSNGLTSFTHLFYDICQNFRRFPGEGMPKQPVNTGDYRGGRRGLPVRCRKREAARQAATSHHAAGGMKIRIKGVSGKVAETAAGESRRVSCRAPCRRPSRRCAQTRRQTLSCRPPRARAAPGSCRPGRSH